MFQVRFVPLGLPGIASGIENVGDIVPSLHRLNALLKPMKGALHGTSITNGTNLAHTPVSLMMPLIDRHSLVPNLPDNCSLLAGAFGVPNLGPFGFDVNWEDVAPLGGDNIRGRALLPHQLPSKAGGIGHQKITL